MKQPDFFLLYYLRVLNVFNMSECALCCCLEVNRNSISPVVICVLLHQSCPSWLFFFLLCLCQANTLTGHFISLVDVRGQKRMSRLVRDDWKTTVTQITTRYNQDMQNTISERTTRRTLKQMGYSSRRPHRVPLLSDKNRTRRLQFTQAHQNWPTEDCKNVAWSDESRLYCSV